MLRVPVYAQEAEKPVVKIESPARGAADFRRTDDAGGIEGVRLRPRPGSSAVARGAAEGTRRKVSQAARGVGELRKVSARLSAHDGRMGFERKEGRDANQAAGEADGILRAQ